MTRGGALDSADSMTALLIADAEGVSRATAQRYLADLVRSGQVTLTLRFGTTGRPEHYDDWREASSSPPNQPQ